MTENHYHCEEARRADAAIRVPVPKGSLVQRELARPKAVTEGLSGVAGHFWGDLCRVSRPFPRDRGADAPLCAATQGNRGGSPQPPVGHDDPGVPPSRPPAGRRGRCPRPTPQIPFWNLDGRSHTPGAPRRERLRSFCRGRAPSRPAGECFRPAPISVGSRTLPTPRRGGPTCPPGHVSLRNPSTGRHIGRPLQALMQYSSAPEKGRKPHPGRTPPSPSCSVPPGVAVRSDSRAGGGWMGPVRTSTGRKSPPAVPAGFFPYSLVFAAFFRRRYRKYPPQSRICTSVEQGVASPRAKRDPWT